MTTLSVIILESLYLWPLALGVGVLLTVGLIWLYPPQIRGSRWGGRLALGLRWAAMAALTLALLKPVVLRSGGAGDVGGVDVLIDCSKSMGVVDTARTPAQRVSLAAALGRLPEGVRSDVPPTILGRVARLEALAKKLSDAQSDVEFARVTGRAVVERQSALRTAADDYAAAAHRLSELADSVSVGSRLRSLLEQIGTLAGVEPRRWPERGPVVRALREQAQNFQAEEDAQLYASDAQVREACDALAKLSRLELAEEALTRRDGLVDQLGARGPVSIYAIDHELKPVAIGSGGLRLKADARGSDLTAAVGGAVAAAAARPVRAVVLISDGRQVGGRADLTSPIRPSGVPVFTLGVAAANVLDTWISRIAMPLDAFAGETIEGQVEVRSVGTSEVPQAVTISGASGRQVLRLQPRPGPDGKPSVTDLVARFAIPIDPPGQAAAERVTFSIDPVRGEASQDNDHAERWVKVSSASPRVMAFTAAPTWDFQYLRASLENRRWLRFDAQVLDAARPRLTLTPQQIRGLDVIILHDLPVDALDVNQWDAVSRLVTDGGGSVIVIAGTQTSVADWARSPIAGGLLPFHDVKPTWKQWPGELPAFRFSPTRLGESLGMRLGDGVESLHRWAELPGVYRFLQIPDKNLYGDVSKLLVETDGGGAVLTERRMGPGHVFFLGIDETWRWSTKAGERDADRFWRQLVKHAAGEPYAASRGNVSLDVDRVACDPSETVKVRARVRSIASASGPELKSIPLQIVHDGKPVRTETLSSTGGGKFGGAVSQLPEGDYVLRISGVGRGRRGRGGAVAEEGVSVPLHVEFSDESEMRDLAGDPHLLERIAKSAGGDYQAIDDVNRLPEMMNTLRGADSRLVRRPVYTSPLLFGFVLACLSGEWAMRKRLGLA